MDTLTMVKRYGKVAFQLSCIFITSLLLRVLQVRFEQSLDYANEEKYSVLDKDLSGQPLPTTFRFADNVSLPLEYQLKGCIFVDSPAPCIETHHPVRTGLLHSFASYFEDKVSHKFVDPPGDNSYYVLSPALAIRGGKLKVYARIMLDRLRYRYHKHKSFPLNQFSANYIYTETFGTGMVPKDNGEILSIPMPVVPLESDGPMDPRVFTHNGRLYLMVLMFTHIGELLWKPHPLIWDLEKSKLFIPSVNLTYNPRAPQEKNWSPLVINRTLYLVHNLDPLRIVQCDIRHGSIGCQFVQDDSQNFKFERRKHVLRGGTPFILYKWPYYIALAHSVVIQEKQGVPYDRVRRYEANLVVMRAVPNFRIVYVSNALKFNDDLYKNISMVYYEGQVKVDNEFVYPVSIIRESSDSIAIGGHVKDRVSVLLRLTGIRSIMSHISALDSVTKSNVSHLEIQQFVRKNFPLN
ncbi:hypothetical protein CAPTEDRAFT_212896 [Capitella teleta]|uniref:Uncharacterized protein n=1 Tax=Capitella teleta TaxID=283909 RepID=R7THS9_CAPTE|nr:hypothetical protein CAPTEDRAFT_212896 [Capitella teleta]|eukprot:ELT93353.1 hypothetical protein CAPTEDRAFT_212896 [Capitella teleta]